MNQCAPVAIYIWHVRQIGYKNSLIWIKRNIQEKIKPIVSKLIQSNGDNKGDDYTSEYKHNC